MSAGNTPKLAIAMNYIDDDLISEAIDYIPTSRKRIPYFWTNFAAVAVCLCLVVSSIWYMQHSYSDEGRRNMPIGTDAIYQVDTFTVSEITDPIKLFAYSVVPPEDICDVVSRYHPNVDCTKAIYVFSYAEDMNENYWFPVMENGRMVEIFFATYDSKGNVITGHSESYVDEFNSIAKFTSKETPVYIVAMEYYNYYVIGDTAYVSSNVNGIENAYIGEFIDPDKDFIVIEIS